MLGDADDCKVAGEYDPAVDDLMWSLLDAGDPSKGVSLHLLGSPEFQCKHDDSGASISTDRTFTIDILCDGSASANPYYIDYVQEPSHCQYHAEMRSIYGCPRECGVTGNGLCDGHGYCAWDNSDSSAHCYCNEGWSGSDCASTASLSSGGSGFGTQIGLLVTLLISSVVLVAYVVRNVYR
jgi:hypothetical protein